MRMYLARHVFCECCVCTRGLLVTISSFVDSNCSVSLVITFGDEDGIDATAFTFCVTCTPHDSF